MSRTINARNDHVFESVAVKYRTDISVAVKNRTIVKDIDQIINKHMKKSNQIDQDQLLVNFLLIVRNLVLCP